MQGHNHDYRQEIKKREIMLFHTNKITGSQHLNKIQAIHLQFSQEKYILNTLHTRPSALFCK